MPQPPLKTGASAPSSSLGQATADPDVIFDLAAPPAAHLELLRALPDGAAVLIQKPMGRTLDEATAILRLCRQKALIAAVNFQLRFAPMVLPLRAAIAGGALGRIVDVEVHLNLHTPWHLFPFVKGLERVEIAVHSIHYLDLIRAVLGNPAGVHARTLGHPGSEVAQTRTAAILDFAPDVRCVLSINHDHGFGRRFQDATLRFEGDKGAAVLKLGLLLDYPRGEPDELWINAEWRVGAGAAHRRLVPRCLRRAHGEPAALRGRRGRRPGKRRRRCLAHDGAGRGLLPFGRGAGDAGSRLALNAPGAHRLPRFQPRPPSPKPVQPVSVTATVSSSLM